MSLILNKKQLATNPLRKDALEIIESGYQAIEIKSLIQRRVKLEKNFLCVSDAVCKEKIDLNKFKRVFVIGFGKGAHLAVSSIADILGNKIYQAYALDVKGASQPEKKNKKVKYLIGTHPKPSKLNVDATKKILEVLKGAKENDLIIYFIGGGGSSLLCGSLGELKSASFVFDKLTKAGALIQEINVIRKHLSEVKGGGLAKFSYPAHSVSLIVSDVCGNDMSSIASGPTFLDKTKILDAIEIFKKYKISFKGIVFVETPKEKKYFKNCKYFLLACNEDAALAMQEKARKLGYKAIITDLALEKNANEIFYFPIKRIKNGQAFVMAGESTVVIKGNGKGGRNQHACLSVLARAFDKKLDINNCLVSSFSSDGYDNTPFAGAIADSYSLSETKKLNLNPKKYLDKNDSHNFFAKEGDFIRVERKAFNVSDLMLVIKSK